MFALQAMLIYSWVSLQVQNSIRIAPRLSGSTDHIIAEGRDSPVGSWALHMQGAVYQ